MKLFKSSCRLLIVTLLLILPGCEEGENSNNEETAAEKPVNVETMFVSPKSVVQSINLTGILQPVNSVEVIGEISGKVTCINNNIGDRITTGDVLAVIDDIVPSSQLKQAEAQVLSASNNLEIAQSNFNSDKILFENGDISELAYNNSKLAVKTAEANHLSALALQSVAQKNYNDTRIKSPIKGTIARKYINLGSMTGIGSRLFDIVDISKLKIELNVAQEYVNRIKTNSKSKIIVSALNDEVYQGIVKRISPQADADTGGYLVEVEADNSSGGHIKGGMTAKVEIILSSLDDQLVIPDYALLTKNNENYVYKIVGENAVLTKVQPGQLSDGYITINDGLVKGDQIVIVGFKNLGTNTKVKIENSTVQE